MITSARRAAPLLYPHRRVTPRHAQDHDFAEALLSAPHWYSSGNFWIAAGVIVAAVVGFAAVRATYVVGSAKRRMTYTVPWNTSLLTSTTSDNLKSKLQVSYRSEPGHPAETLTDPSVIWLRLASSGRKDIRSADFDQNRPIVIDVGTKIIELLNTDSAPKGTHMPRIMIAGTTIAVGPDLIRKGQTITITILTDGPTPEVKWDSSLIDVETREAEKIGVEFERSWPSRVDGIALVLIIILTVGFGLFAHSQHLWPFQRCSTATTAHPNAPIPKALASDQGAQVHWQTPKCGGPITKYLVFGYDLSTGTIATQATVFFPASGFIFSGLKNGHEYTFAVLAINSRGFAYGNFGNNVIPPSQTLR